MVLYVRDGDRIACRVSVVIDLLTAARGKFRSKVWSELAR
jgi:hypothetical protein